MDAARLKFHGVMTGCGVFVIAALASLVYVCSRPQTPAVRSAEQHAIVMCREKSTDLTQTAIFRSEMVKACNEMQKQYVRKFKQLP